MIISIKNNTESNIIWGYINISPNNIYNLYDSNNLKTSYENYIEMDEFGGDWYNQITNNDIIVLIDNIEENIENGIKRIHEFRRICSNFNIESIYKTNSDNTLIMKRTHGLTDGNIGIKGRKHICPAGQTVFWDIPVEIDKYKLADAKITINDFSQVNSNDYIEASLIDKDNVTGLFGLLGLTVDQDVLELRKQIETLYVRPEFHFGHFYGEVDIIKGLYIRMIYNSFGTNDVIFLTDQYSYE